jgi:hypothetical protein
MDGAHPIESGAAKNGQPAQSVNVKPHPSGAQQLRPREAHGSFDALDGGLFELGKDLIQLGLCLFIHHHVF